MEEGDPRSPPPCRQAHGGNRLSGRNRTRMGTMSNTNRHETKTEGGRWSSAPDTSLSLIFSSHVVSPDHAARIIDRAVDFRDLASDSARSTLNSAITDGIDVLRFRDASRAPADQLKAPILIEVFNGNDRLAGGVLRVWSDSEEDLRSFVAEYLKAKDIPIDGPDLRSRRFHSIWLRSEWRKECDEITGTDTSRRFDKDDVGLMLCYVSGWLADPNRVETAGIDSELFLKFINELDDLPSAAPDWEHADLLINAFKQLADDKAIDRRLAHTQALRQAIVEVKDEFTDELRYLDLTIAPLRHDYDQGPLSISESLGVIEKLRSSLIEYRPIRPQGATRTEEQERARQREECETNIFELTEKWVTLMTSPIVRVDEPPSQELPKVASESGSTTASDSDQSDTGPALSEQAPAHDLETIRSELEQSRLQSDSLRAENTLLAQESANLRADMNMLDKQNSELKNELSLSRDMQEYWRRAYVAESAGQAREGAKQPVQLTSVNDALALAENSFPDRLRLALNSKSAKNSPFQKPEEVFHALAWLATEYHRLRSNPGDAPNFDTLIKEACPGWAYRPKQTEITKEQFAEWYTTILDGKPYELDAHIGKGTSFDPHQTIRIAFDWDDDMKQVIVGYIGRHQRNRRS